MKAAIATADAHPARQRVEEHAHPTPPSVEELEAEITTLAAHLNAATYRFLMLIADFDRREGWGGTGIRSCAHWLNWKCSLGMVAAREKLRVAHALENLPQIAGAMQQGRLSYAKVRAMTRIATSENERFLLTIADNGTASHVENTVRHYRRTRRLEELDRDKARYQARGLRYYWDEDGCLAIEGRLPPEQGAVVVKALKAASLILDQARNSKQSASAESSFAEAMPDSSVTPSRAEPPDPVPLDTMPSRAVPDPEPNLSDEPLDPELLEALATLEQAMREEAEREIVRASAESPNGDQDHAASPVVYSPPSHNRPGPSNASAESPPSDVPNWGNQQADAFALMAETYLAKGPVALRNGDKHLVNIDVDLSALCSVDAAGKSAIEDGPAIPPETVRRLCCDAGLVTWLEDRAGKTLDVGRKTRAIPPAIRRALDNRDGGCRFPGCENRRFVDAHHIEHWIDGGETKLDNLVSICRYHHRLLHEGGFRILQSEHGPRFAHPDGRLIPRVPQLPQPPRAGATALAEQHAKVGLTITPRTAIPHWGGERADYNYVLMVLDQYDERQRARSRRETVPDHGR